MLLKNYFKKLFSFFFIFANIYSIQHSDLNILVTRAPGKDIYLKEADSFFLKHAADNRKKSKYGSSFRIIPFYQKMQNPRKIGSYFGLKGKSAGIIYKQGRLVGADIDSTTLLHDAIPDEYLFEFNISENHRWYVYKKPKNEDDLGHVYHVEQKVDGTPQKNADGSYTLTTEGTPPVPSEGPLTNSNANNVKIALQDFEQNDLPKRALAGQLSLKAEREIFGLLFAYYFYLTTGFWIEISIPFLYFKQGLMLKIENENKSKSKILNKDVSIQDTLNGTYENLQAPNNVDDPNQQKKLLYSKFVTEKIKEYFFGDPDVLIGYRIFNSEISDCDVYFKTSVPITQSINPEFLFPPQPGNNGHFMLGAGIKCSSEIFRFQEMSLDGYFNFNLNYSFANTQKRTLGSFSDRGVIIPWDRYSLVAKLNSSGPMEPFGNVSTTDTKVYPGFSGESYFELVFSYKNFMFSLGHSAFPRSCENVVLEKWPNDSKYGRPSTSAYRTDQRYVPENFPFGEIDATSITKSEAETETCSTPGSFSNLIFAQVGYNYLEDNNRLFSSSLGVSFEFAKENSSLNNLTIFSGLGFTF